LGSCPDWAHAPHAPRTPSHPPTSTTHISTTMEAIDKAIEDLKLHGLLVKGQLKRTAEKYGVNWSTLGRR
jgi:hypothetical protein